MGLHILFSAKLLPLGALDRPKDVLMFLLVLGELPFLKSL